MPLLQAFIPRRRDEHRELSREGPERLLSLFRFVGTKAFSGTEHKGAGLLSRPMARLSSDGSQCQASLQHKELLVN